MNLRRYLLWYDQNIEFTEIFVKSSMEENFKTISIKKKKKKNCEVQRRDVGRFAKFRNVEKIR